MRVTIESLVLPVAGAAPLGVQVVAPIGPDRAPGLLFYTDIFGRNAASVRMMMRFAGYGFTVFAPDLYRRREPLGVALDFTLDYDRAQRDAQATTVEHFDADRRLTLAAMRAHPRVDAASLSAAGFCIGGHLALRAAVEPDVRAILAYYPTGLHDGSLGGSRDAGTLAALPASAARLFIAYGSLDPHTDASARALVASALCVEAGAGSASPTSLATYPGEHAFMRDEGPRYDPELTDRAFSDGIAWLGAGRAENSRRD